jgi:Fic family protein
MRQFWPWRGHIEMNVIEQFRETGHSRFFMSSPVPYHLGKFPPTELIWDRLIPLLGPASAGLARYDGLLSAIPNASVLLSPLTTQEAVLSSRIEGTQATMGEVLEVEAGGDPGNLTEPKRGDVEEILNYRQAMRGCVTALRTLPLSQRLLKDAHSTLLKGVRGQSSDPGNYRRIENWIGPKGCSQNEASLRGIRSSSSVFGW